MIAPLADRVKDQAGDQTYTVTVTFTVHPDSDERLRDERAMRDEVERWLDSLDATVRTVRVLEEARW